MLRPAERDDEQGIDPYIVALAGVTRSEALCGGYHAAQAPIVERETGRVVGRSRLHFDEGEGASPPSDNVDFASGNARPPREDPPAMQAQIPAGERFGAAPAFLRFVPVQFDRSSARA